MHCCLTPEAPATLAVEHLSLLDLAFGTVLAGIRLAGVVPTFANPAAKKAVAVALLKVEHPVVDVQHADAAHQTRGDPCPFPHTEETERCTRQRRQRNDVTGGKEKDKKSYSCFSSSVTPPINSWVSRLRPSVPGGLSPWTCGSLSTLSTATRRLRVTTS